MTWRGSSVIDVTWATSEAYRRISNWRVAEGVETLSDHLYILMEVAHHETTSAAIQASSPRGANRLRLPPRWRLKERNREMLQAAVSVSAWSWDARRTSGSVDEEAESLRRDMSAACDSSMPCSVPGYGRNQCVYWWTPEIADTRARCVRARRRLQRARRVGGYARRKRSPGTTRRTEKLGAPCSER